MNKEKHIEEMAFELENHTCMSQFQAEIASKMLYALNYRKASEVAREIFGMLREDLRGEVDMNYLERLIEIYEKKYKGDGE